MTRTQSVRAARAWAAAAALVVVGACASTAVAATAVDIPAQVFPRDPIGARPAVNFKWGSELPTQGRDWAVGRSLRVNLPVGAKERLPVMVHIFSSEEVCHDNMDFTAAAAVRNQEQDFIRGGDH